MKTTQQALCSVFLTDRLQKKPLQNEKSFGTGEAALLGRVGFRKVCVSVCVCVYIYIYIHTHTHTHTQVDFTRNRDTPKRLYPGSEVKTRTRDHQILLKTHEDRTSFKQ